MAVEFAGHYLPRQHASDPYTVFEALDLYLFGYQVSNLHYMIGSLSVLLMLCAENYPHVTAISTNALINAGVV